MRLWKILAFLAVLWLLLNWFRRVSCASNCEFFRFDSDDDSCESVVSVGTGSVLASTLKRVCVCFGPQSVFLFLAILLSRTFRSSYSPKWQLVLGKDDKVGTPAAVRGMSTREKVKKWQEVGSEAKGFVGVGGVVKGVVVDAKVGGRTEPIKKESTWKEKRRNYDRTRS